MDSIHEDERLQSVLIVGGGVAGAMAACSLARLFGAGERQKPSLTLLDDGSDDSIAGCVAAAPTFKRWLADHGIAERDLLLRCRSSFCLATLYEGWLRPGQRFWHPFGPLPRIQVERLPGGALDLMHAWLGRELSGNSPGPFAQAAYGSTRLCSALKSPKGSDDPDWRGFVGYGYQLDARALAALLRERARALGATVVRGTPREVRRDKRDHILWVETEDGTRLEGELFLDCTGSGAQLIGGKLSGPGGNSPCDRMLTVELQRNGAADGLPPYVSARALENGWLRIRELADRRVFTLVHSAAHLGEDRARADLGSATEGGEERGEPRASELGLGLRSATWRGNCIALGAAAGRAEPVEPGALVWIQEGLTALIQNFPDRNFDAAVRGRYQARLAELHGELVDLAALPYALTSRNDSEFWRAAHGAANRRESVRERMALWREMWPWEWRTPGTSPLDLHAHACLFAGMEALPTREPPLLRYLDLKSSGDHFARTRHHFEKNVLRGLPDQYDYLSRLAQHPEAAAELGAGAEPQRSVGFDPGNP